MASGLAGHAAGRASSPGANTAARLGCACLALPPPGRRECRSTAHDQLRPRPHLQHTLLLLALAGGGGAGVGGVCQRVNAGGLASLQPGVREEADWARCLPAEGMAPTASALMLEARAGLQQRAEARHGDCSAAVRTCNWLVQPQGVRAGHSDKHWSSLCEKCGTDCLPAVATLASPTAPRQLTTRMHIWLLGHFRVAPAGGTWWHFAQTISRIEHAWR